MADQGTKSISRTEFLGTIGILFTFIGLTSLTLTSRINDLSFNDIDDTRSFISAFLEMGLSYFFVFACVGLGLAYSVMALVARNKAKKQSDS